MNRQSFDFEGPMHDIQYRYDANGNRRARIANGYTDYYAVDGRDRLWWVNRRNGEPTSGQADPYTIYNYDANGNTVYRERRHDATTLRKLALIWDSDDRLKRVWQDDGTNVTSIFNGLYDEDGLRVQKTDSWTGTHNYSWGPGGIVHDTAGTSYTPGLHQQAGGTDRFFHSDWLGSTRYLSDSAGTGLPSALRYDAFGNRSATGGTDAYHSTDFQFAGASGYQQEYASATEPGLGLQYLEQRYYDPAVGRFISPDPIGFAGGLNLYGYADGDPVNGVDPSGLVIKRDLGGLVDRGDPKVRLPSREMKLGIVDFVGLLDAYTALTGRDALTNERVPKWQQGLSALPFVSRLGGLAGLRRLIGNSEGWQRVCSFFRLQNRPGSIRLPVRTGPAAGTLIPWSSTNLGRIGDPIRRNLAGPSKANIEVTVDTLSEAQEIFLNLFQGAGYRNSTGFDSTEADKFFGSKVGTYHYDFQDTLHGGRSHLQVHDFGGRIIRIFFKR